jgi:drug/metabolite transporter (DMT)-like permease
MTGILFICLACLVWAVDTLIRYPLLGRGHNAAQIIFFEHFFLTLLFVPSVFKLLKKLLTVKKNIVFSFFMIGGVGSALSTLAFTKAFTLLNPSLVILLQKLQPVVAITLSGIFLKEKIDSKFIFWAAICVLGGLGVSYQQVFGGLNSERIGDMLNSNEPYMGVVLSLFAVIGWGSATVFGKYLQSNDFKTNEIMSGRFFFGLLTSSYFIFSTPNILTGVGQIFLRDILLLVLLSGVIGMFFYYRGLNRLPARVATLAELFFPLCAVIVNWLYLNSTLDWIQIVSAVVLVFGSTFIQMRRY